MASTDVYILGQKYTLKSPASEEQIQGLADDINGRINDVCTKFPNVPPAKALILTLFNMADEIRQLSSVHDNLAEDIQKKAELLSSLFE